MTTIKEWREFSDEQKAEASGMTIERYRELKRLAEEDRRNNRFEDRFVSKKGEFTISHPQN